MPDLYKQHDIHKIIEDIANSCAFIDNVWSHEGEPYEIEITHKNHTLIMPVSRNDFVLVLHKHDGTQIDQFPLAIHIRENADRLNEIVELDREPSETGPRVMTHEQLFDILTELYPRDIRFKEVLP